MKALLIFFIVLIIGITCHGQQAQDSSKVKMPPDSLSIISIRDVSVFFKWLRENISVSNYEKLKPEDLLNELVNWSLIEYGKKKKK